MDTATHHHHHDLMYSGESPVEHTPLTTSLIHDHACMSVGLDNSD